MKLVRLDIRTLPGVHPGFRIEDLAPGVNFITGPNASGKSSIIRSLRYLLDAPGSGDPPALDLLARFAGDDQTWRVQRQGRSCRWEINGQSAERPTLPEGDALGCYLVTIEDLFRLEGGNHRFLAEQLRRELNQGYDLATLRENTYPLQPKIGRNEQKALLEQRETLRDVTSRQRTVSDEEQRLPEIARDLEHARSSAADTQHLETALQLIDAKSSVDELVTRLSSFSREMRRLHGRETEHLDQLEQRQQMLEQQLEQQREAHTEARRILEHSGLSEGHPDDDELSRQQQKISRLEQTENQLQIQRDNQGNADLQLHEAQRRLQIDDLESEKLPEISKNQLRDAQTLATELEDQSAHVRRLEQRLADSDDRIDEQAMDRYQRAVHILRDWLSAPAPRPNYWISGTLAAAGALCALAGGLIIGPAWLSVAGAILMLIGLSVALISKRSAIQPPSAHAESQLSAQRIDTPSSWTRWSVQQRLSELEHELTRQKLALERQKQQADIERDLKHSVEEHARLESERRALAKNIGFDPSLTTRAMAQFLADLDAFHEAHFELEQSRQSVHRLEQKRLELRDEILPFLQQWLGIETNGNEPTELLAARLQKLQRLCGQARESQTRLQQAQRDIERIEHEHKANRRSIETLYEEAGLESGQRAELEHRLLQLDEWRELEHQLRTARDNVNVTRQRLASRPGLLERVDKNDRDRLENELRDAKQMAARLGPLSEEQGNIKARIDDAGLAHAREQAMAAVAMAQDRLAEKRASVIETNLAHFLLDEIESEHRRESEPPLLEHARESFRAFTHHQWDLEFTEANDAGFSARERSLDEKRSLAELSTGTRMQLLLALRLGQIRLREQSGAPLPLIIDEALTTSDARRASVIMNNLQTLADEENRQIIYLAAGEHEFRLWEHATGNAPHLIDLGTIRGRLDQVDTPQFEPPTPIHIAKPDGRSAVEYARTLEVPAINPREEAGSIHALHLVHDDLNLLHELMKNWRINTLGQLDNLLQSSAAQRAIADKSVRERLAQRCHITREWVSAWRIGRGKPVTRATLEHARTNGILSDLNINGVAQRAAEVEWQPVELLRGLEAPIVWDNGNERRLQGRKLDELRDFLIERGHLDPRKPLTPNERRQRLVLLNDGNATIAAIQEQVDWLEAVNGEQQQIELKLK